MIRAVLDTNVLASGATHSAGHSGQLVMAWRRRAFQLIVSEHILDELAETLEDRYFKRRLTRRERQAAVNRLRQRAELSDAYTRLTGLDLSAEDSQVLATAVSAGAEYVVTGDDEFLAIEQYHGIRIVTPSEFLGILRHST